MDGGGAVDTATLGTCVAGLGATGGVGVESGTAASSVLGGVDTLPAMLAYGSTSGIFMTRDKRGGRTRDRGGACADDASGCMGWSGIGGASGVESGAGAGNELCPGTTMVPYATPAPAPRFGFSWRITGRCFLPPVIRFMTRRYAPMRLA